MTDAYTSTPGSPPTGRSYPWVYRPGAAQWTASGLVVAALVFGAVATWTLCRRPDATPAVVGILAGLYLIGAITFCAMLGLFLTSAVVRADRVEVRSVFGRRSLRRDDIAGWREVGLRDARLELRPRRAGGRPVTIRYYQSDEMQRWLSGLPNLEEVGRDPEAPAGPPSGVDPARARIADFAWKANWSAPILIAWLVFLPFPYFVVVTAAALAPVLAVALLVLGRGAVVMDAPLDFGRPAGRRPAQPPVVLGLFVAGDALCVRLADYPLLNGVGEVFWLVLGVWAAAIVAIAAVAAFMARPGRRTYLLATVLAIAAFGWSLGLVVQLNALVETHAVRRYSPAILVKWTETGGRGHRAYLMKLERLGGDIPPPLRVSQADYDRYSVGAPYCADVHQGWLNLRWFKPCRAGPRR